MSRFPESFIADVKSRFRLSEYIGRTVPLKKAGAEMVGLSPFSKEKTPSFYVNDDKAFFFDFSSGKNGDILVWLQESERLNFVEAIERLAGEAGLPLPERDERSDEQDRRRRSLEQVLEQAQGWFRAQLARSPEALAYLERRGISSDDAERYGLGYAPNLRQGLQGVLQAAKAEQVAAGVVAVTDSGEHLDRYRHRITFPIHDAGGRLISFGGRTLDPQARAKYLNGPDSELFDKGRQLYGLHWARKLLAGGAGPLVVVEGYMDVIACLRAGVAACAPMGTSLTPLQMELMWRFHPEPTLCLDADSAGRRAAAKAMDNALPKLAPQRTLRFAIAAGAKDPDQVLREQGPEALRRQISAAAPFVSAVFERELTAAPLDTPEQRADLRERLRKVVRAIGDPALARDYGAAFKQKLDAHYSRDARKPAATTALDSAKALRTSAPPLRAALAYWLLKEPARGEPWLERLSGCGFGHPGLDALAQACVGWWLEGGGDAEALAQHLHRQGLADVAATLGPDLDGRGAEPSDWARRYGALADYLDAERALQSAKGAVRSAEDMDRFNTLKQQRDHARKALDE